MRRASQLAGSTATTAATRKSATTSVATSQPQQLAAQRLSSQEGQQAAAPKPGSLRGLPRIELLYICGIFAITGSSAAYFVRPSLKFLLSSSDIGLSCSQLMGIPDPVNASLGNGPWTFRILYFAFMMPMYSLLLFSYGTLFGRGLFFRHFLVKMWSRMLPKPLHDRLKLVLVGVVE